LLVYAIIQILLVMLKRYWVSISLGLGEIFVVMLGGMLGMYGFWMSVENDL
jgi:hypothetical protein